MSTTFMGGKGEGMTWKRVRARREREDGEHPIGFNLNIGNAVSFLRLLELSPEPYGSVPIVTMVRAVQKAKASFDYRVDAVTRALEEGGGNGRAWFHVAGADVPYFQLRLEQFSELLADWIELGAECVTWG